MLSVQMNLNPDIFDDESTQPPHELHVTVNFDHPHPQNGQTPSPVEENDARENDADVVVVGEQESEQRRATKRKADELLPPTVEGPSCSQLNGSMDEGTTCTICCEPYTATGEHRLVTLSDCGHLFGYSCIEQWFTHHRPNCCPICKRKSGRRKIVKLFTKGVRVIDNSELERLRDDAERERNLRVAAETEAKKLETKAHQLQLRNAQLQRSMLHFNQQPLQEVAQPPAASNTVPAVKLTDFRLSPIKNFELIGTASKYACRTLAFSAPLRTLICSQPNPSGQFFGNGSFALRQIVFRDSSLQLCMPVALHDQEIRDITVSPGEGDVLLTASHDMRVNMVNIQNMKSMAEILLPDKVWSVTWRDPQTFLAGLNDGQVWGFDTRMIGDGSREPLYKLKCPERFVVKMAWVPTGKSGFLERCSMSYDGSREQFLISGAQKHTLFSIHGLPNGDVERIAAFDPVKTFSSAPMAQMTRSLLATFPEGSEQGLIGIWNAGKAKLEFRDANTFTSLPQLSVEPRDGSGGPVFDSCLARLDQEVTYLNLLQGHNLRILKMEARVS